MLMNQLGDKHIFEEYVAHGNWKSILSRYLWPKIELMRMEFFFSFDKTWQVFDPGEMLPRALFKKAISLKPFHCLKNFSVDLV